MSGIQNTSVHTTVSSLIFSTVLTLIQYSERTNDVQVQLTHTAG